MRTMVIVNHPYEGSFCHALADAAAQGHGGPGREVDLLDLDASGFDPVMRRADLAAWRDRTTHRPRRGRPAAPDRRRRPPRAGAPRLVGDRTGRDEGVHRQGARARLGLRGRRVRAAPRTVRPAPARHRGDHDVDPGTRLPVAVRQHRAEGVGARRVAEDGRAGAMAEPPARGRGVPAAARAVARAHGGPGRRRAAHPRDEALVPVG